MPRVWRIPAHPGHVFVVGCLALSVVRLRGLRTATAWPVQRTVGATFSVAPRIHVALTVTLTSPWSPLWRVSWVALVIALSVATVSVFSPYSGLSERNVLIDLRIEA
jgi:hypothetical protein